MIETRADLLDRVEAAEDRARRAEARAHEAENAVADALVVLARHGADIGWAPLPAVLEGRPSGTRLLTPRRGV